MTDVTIVCATYNRPRLLPVMLESILASAALVPESVRIVVVDDGSDLPSARHIAARLGVDYIRRRENGGVAAALATGFEAVDSEFFALWGDDDAFLPCWFPLHLAKIREGFDVVSGSFQTTGPDLIPRATVILPPVTLHDLKRNRIHANDGSLVRRSSLGDIRLRPERERAMMMTFWLAMAAGRRRFATISEPTWLYRRHPGQLSRQRTDPRFLDLRRQAIAEYA